MKEAKVCPEKFLTLPYSNYPEEFEEDFSDICKSDLLQTELIKYLEDKVEEKESWVKGYMKNQFCCGMCSSSSRIESKHRVLKLYLNSGKRLTELFQIVKELEKKEVAKMANEIEKSRKNERKKQEKMDIIKYFKEIYSEYVLEVLKDNLMESTNYSITQITSNTWYLYCIFLN